MSSVAEQIDEIKILQYCQLAAAVIIIYEHFITIDQEIDLIWKKKWSLVKCIFICNRYIGGGVSMGNAIGRAWAWVQAIGGYLALWAMQGILQLRAHAMASPYPSPLRIPIQHVMTVIFGCEIIAMGVILGFSYAHISSMPVVFERPSMSICAPSGVALLWAIWIPAAVFETFLAACVLWVAFRHLTTQTHGVLSTDQGRKLLWKVLLRDSILFPIVSVSVYIANAILWSTLRPELVQLPESFVACATCILGSRLVLNLREAYYTPFADELKTANGAKVSSRASDALSFRHSLPRTPMEWRVARNPSLEHGSDDAAGSEERQSGHDLPSGSTSAFKMSNAQKVSSPSPGEPGYQFRYLPQERSDSEILPPRPT
ncbi:hypothetical protein HGRIS_012096 [Hohenbuehelia grisea]|uniref:DUF6533 domain-containing protein n=1 Tax=Hohenbuehelia grisea TaxID=104357 RepID=A0ABR3IR96_9AGAR